MDFPEWKPLNCSMKRMNSEEFRTRYKALRYSSDSFIHRPDVRQCIYQKNNGRCYLCGKTENLQIDHIVSVYRYAREKIEPIKGLNSYDNLALICGSCNSKKTP